MTNKLPIIRQINWLTFTLQMIVLALCIWWLNIYLGAFVYLTFLYAARGLLTRKHRKGMNLLKKGHFDDAIFWFQDSYAFFSKHTLLNNYVGMLLSTSKITYKEMAQLNMAYCYILKKDGKKAKEIYEQTLSAFPNSMIAKNALHTFEAMKNVE